jgi:SAM-dependent methyltransferase
VPFPEEAFDVVVCQLGLQFFTDRSEALREIQRVLSPNGRLALNVFAAIERNPATLALADFLDRHLRVDASVVKRTEHALPDTEELRALLTAAGFRDVVIQTTRKTVRFPSFRDYVRIQFAATPLANLIVRLDAARREHLLEAVVADVAASLAVHVGDDGFSFPQEVHVAVATD